MVEGVRLKMESDRDGSHYQAEIRIIGNGWTEKDALANLIFNLERELERLKDGQ